MDFKLILGVVMLLALPFTATSGTCDLVDIKEDQFQGIKGKVHRGFVGAIRTINDYAKLCKVKIYLTSSFRKDTGGEVSGAIVTPSRISNHFIGHAIDMNLIDGRRFCNSKCLGDPSKRTKGVNCFISKTRGNGILRWGGDFRKSDPVHIDDGTNLRSRSVYNKLYKLIQTSC